MAEKRAFFGSVVREGVRGRVGGKPRFDKGLSVYKALVCGKKVVCILDTTTENWPEHMMDALRRGLNALGAFFLLGG